MLKQPIYHVNKVKYKGPKTFTAIVRQIAQNAEAEGRGHLDEGVISRVLKFVFSKRGALSSIPYYAPASVFHFGTWQPDPQEKKLRQQYYIERNRHHSEFQVKRNALVKFQREIEAEYQQYLKDCKAEIPLSFLAWKINKKYENRIREMNYEMWLIKKRFVIREQGKYKYLFFKLRKPRFVKKRILS